MKKLIIVVFLGILTLSLAACGQADKRPDNLAGQKEPVKNEVKEDRTFGTGQVAGEEDIETVEEKPLSPESL